ncbi:SpnB-like Rossmann fold domain-containing protein, partial [Streptomyces aculeolatus]
AALQTTRQLPDTDPDDTTTRLPFAWHGVTFHASAARELRVRAVSTGPDKVALELTDPEGIPVASIDALVTRPFTPDSFGAAAARGQESLFRVDWVPVQPTATTGSAPRARNSLTVGADAADLRTLAEELRSGAAVPDVVVADLPEPSGEPEPEQVHALTERTLTLLQVWLSEPEFEQCRLVVLTHGATPAASHPADPVQAAVWGLVHTAQNEHPDRITLVDLDRSPATERGLHTLLTSALATGEPQIALRDGTPTVPRLTHAASPAPAGPDAQAPSPAFDPEGTVLITGGTGTLARLTARHLVT